MEGVTFIVPKGGFFMRFVFPLIAAIALLGCATKYQPTGAAGGFSETRLSDNTWRVVFRGNPIAKADRTDDLALLRAADLALQHGYSFIKVKGANTTSSTVTSSMPTYTTVQGRASTSGNRTNFRASAYTFGGDDSDEIITSTLLVTAFKEKVDAGTDDVYDAKYLCESIGKKYEAKCQVR